MKKILISIYLLLYFNYILSNDIIINFKNKISELNNLKHALKIKENQLNNLKLKSSKSMWNFLDRKNNEYIIQNKNKLNKEINQLYNKIKNIEDYLILNHDEFISKIETNIINPDYLTILNLIDQIYYETLLKLLPQNENISDIELLNKKKQLLQNYAQKIKKFIDYLKYKNELIEKNQIQQFDINIIKKQKDDLIKLYNKLNF